MIPRTFLLVKSDETSVSLAVKRKTISSDDPGTQPCQVCLGNHNYAATAATTHCVFLSVEKE